jgi:6-phosphogluconolactonase
MKRTLTSISIVLGLGFTSAGFAQDSHRDDGGAVFVRTNAAEKNEILSYSRAANGTLRERSRFETGVGEAAA